MLALSPFEARNIARGVKNFDDKVWRENGPKIVCQGLELKVGQHPNILRMLLGTGNKILAECAPFDTFWGVGFSLQHPHSLIPTRWTGLNALGQCWMKIRNLFRTRASARSTALAISP